MKSRRSFLALLGIGVSAAPFVARAVAEAAPLAQEIDVGSHCHTVTPSDGSHTHTISGWVRLARDDPFDFTRAFSHLDAEPQRS